MHVRGHMRWDIWRIRWVRKMRVPVTGRPGEGKCEAAYHGASAGLGESLQGLEGPCEKDLVVGMKQTAS